MSNTLIQLKHSTESGNVPSGLVNGEIAINTFDGKIFYRDPAGVTQSIQNFPGPSGLDGEIQFNDLGDLGASANLTFNKTTGNLSSYTLHTRSYVEFPDGTKQYTANGGSGQSVTITVGILPPASGNSVGDVWIDSNTGIEFTWINDGDSSQWIELGPTSISLEGGGPSGSINVVFDHANAAFNKANSANNLAQAAFDAANNAGSSAQVQTISTHANAAFDKANSANNLAQAAYDYANTISLTGYATETFVVNSIANLVNSAPTTLDTLNELASALGNDANFSTTVTNLIGSAYNQANAANILAQSSYTHANGSFDRANSANVLAQQAYNQANTGTGIASNAYAHANGAFDRGNTANILAQAAFNQANSANVLAQAAYNQANTANLLSVSSSIIPSANITYDLGTPTRRWRDIYLSGNTIDLAGVQISACNGGLTLPSVVAIGNTTIDGTSGGLILPSNTSIGGSAVATPRVSSIDYPGDDTAANPTGGQVIGIVGSGFQSGASVILDGQTISVVTYVNSQRLEITTPAKATGSYIMYIVNPDGGTGIFVPGIQYSGVPTWQSPAAGSLGSVYETNNINQTFSANSDSTVTYSLFSGTLPPGSSLNSSTGVLSGTAALTDNATTYNFTIRATDGENQDTDRAFSLTIDPDVITWVSPANGSSYQLVANSSATVSLTATSAAGDSVVYTANSLPTGISISGSTITGTPTTEQTLSSLITARGNTTNSTATIVLNWSVVVRDLFFRETTLLLNANTNTWITDESPNGFEITPFGDAKPSAFSPFNTNWSNNLESKGHFTFTGTSAFSLDGDFTWECWVYLNSYVGSSYNELTIFNNRSGGSTGTQIDIGNSVSGNPGNFGLWHNGSSIAIAGSGTVQLNRWTHLAIVRSGTSTNNIKLYVNGLQVAQGTSTATLFGSSGTFYIGNSIYDQPFNNLISNLRLTKGGALYTSTFTPPTENLSTTVSSGTVSLLTCRSNRFIDISSNAISLTLLNSPKISSFGPFTETDTTTGSGYFDGTGDCLQIDDNAAFTLGSGNFTLECWIYSFLAGTRQGIVAQIPSNGADAGSSFFLEKQSDNTIRCGIISGSTYYTVTSPSIFGLNTWGHIAFVRDGNTLRLFVNGQQVNTSSVTGITANDSTAKIGIARPGEYTGAVISDFQGHISDVRLVKSTLYTSNFTPPTSPLTPVANTQLLTLQTRTAHNNNTFLDESGNKFNITRSGNATQGSFSPFSPSGWSAYFDGTGDYLSLAGNSIFDITSGNFSVEVWIFRTTNGVEQYLFSQRISGSQGWEWRINATNLMSFFFTGGSSFNSISVIPTNVWTHLAVTRESNTVRMFINGVLDNTATFSNGTSAGSTALFLGYGTTGGGYFQGNLSNARLVKGTALYTSNFTPSTTPIGPVANTVLLTCRSNRFEDEGPNRFAITRNGDTRITPFSPFGPHTITPKTYSGYFDGDTDYVAAPSDAAFAFGTGDYTIEAWVYPTSIRNGENLVYVTEVTQGVSFGYNQTQIYIGARATAFDLQVSYTMPTNQWVHIAAARQSGIVRIFVNGNLIGSGSVTRSCPQGQGVFGSYPPIANQGVIGYISNARVIKGSALYTTNFTPSTTPLTAVANTVLLTCQSESFVDNSNNRFTITANGNATPSKYNPFGETVATNVQYSPTVHGGSVYMDGNGDNLQILDNDAFEIGSGEFTFECWVYLTSYSAAYTGSNYAASIMNKDAPSARAYNIQINGTASSWTNISVGLFPNNTSPVGTIGSFNFSLFTWYHIAVVRSSSTVTIYVNGVSITSATNSTTVQNTNANIQIGSESPGYIAEGYGYYFPGYISNWRFVKGSAVYRNNFIPQPITVNSVNNASLALNFTAAGISDATSKNALETVGDVEVITESPYSLNQSVYFDGNGDYLVFNSSGSAVNFAGAFTVECFFYLTSNLTYLGAYSSYVGRFISAGTSAVTGGIEIGIASSSSANTVPSVIAIGTYGASGGPAATLNATGLSIPLNTWHHLVVVRNSSNVTSIFLNGNRVGTTTITGTYASRNVEVGGNNLNSYNGWFPGYISNLRIVKDSAIYDATQTTLSVPTTPLTAVSGTSLLTCHTNRFIDSSTNNFTITRNGDAKITSRGPFTETRPPRSLKFDGTGDYLKIPYTPNLWFGSSNWTFEAWIYPLSFTDNNVIFDFGYGSPDNLRSIIFYTAQTTGLFRIAQSPNGSTNYDVSTGITLSLNQWHHIACVRNGASIVSYFNGVNTSSITAYDTFNSTSRSFFVGIQGDLQEVTTSHAYIEDLRITKYARYTSNFTPPTTTFLTF